MEGHPRQAVPLLHFQGNGVTVPQASLMMIPSLDHSCYIPLISIPHLPTVHCLPCGGPVVADGTRIPGPRPASGRPGGEG